MPGERGVHLGQPRPGARAHGGPARGVIHPEGWGGPTKGRRPAIQPGDPDGIQRMSHDPERRALNLQRVEELKDHIFTLATTAERQETQLAAAEAFMNRELGTPAASLSAQVNGEMGITMQIVSGVERDDEED